MRKVDEGIFKEDKRFRVQLDKLLESRGFLVTQGTRGVFKEAVGELIKDIWPDVESIEFV